MLLAKTRQAEVLDNLSDTKMEKTKQVGQQTHRMGKIDNNKTKNNREKNPQPNQKAEEHNEIEQDKKLVSRCTSKSLCLCKDSQWSAHKRKKKRKMEVGKILH